MSIICKSCKNCKKEISDNAVFCQFCGKKQVKSERTQKPKSRGNGTGSVYRLPSGKWRAAVTLGYDLKTKKRVYKTKSGFKTKRDALEYLPTLQTNAPRPKSMKFAEVYEEWSAAHYPAISKNKASAYKTAYNKCKPFHYIKISDIRTKDIQAVIDSDKRGYYPKHDIKVLCNLMTKYAIQNDLAEKNYTSYVKLPPVPKSKRDAFSADEIAALWNDYNRGYNFTGFILIMIYTGMRLGELQKLSKDKIFLAENYMIGGIKTTAGIDRQIVICDKIKPIIEIFHKKGKNKLLEMAEDRFYERYYETLERAQTRRLTPHCCRHTFATLMVQSGVSPEITKSIAGHEDYQTTLQYTHISIEEKLKAINKI